MTKPELARKYAIKWHGDQKYGDEPYIVHLDEVAKIVYPHGDECVMVAYLHDVIEDTSITIAELDTYFGSGIACMVQIVSDEPGWTRAFRKDRINMKLAATSRTSALIVKAADRLANVRRGGKLNMYRKEHDAFKKAAYRSGLCDKIWEELDGLVWGKK